MYQSMYCIIALAHSLLARDMMSGYDGRTKPSVRCPWPKEDVTSVGALLGAYSAGREYSMALEAERKRKGRLDIDNTPIGHRQHPSKITTATQSDIGSIPREASSVPLQGMRNNDRRQLHNA